jgi:hypothetical protein
VSEFLGAQVSVVPSKYLGGPEFGGIKIHFGSGDGKQMGLS